MIYNITTEIDGYDVVLNYTSSYTEDTIVEIAGITISPQKVEEGRFKVVFNSTVFGNVATIRLNTSRNRVANIYINNVYTETDNFISKDFFEYSYTQIPKTYSVEVEYVDDTGKVDFSHDFERGLKEGMLLGQMF